MSTTTQKSTYLSTATAHLLSIRSNAVTKVAGHANAATSVLNTVIMAPPFINSDIISTTLNIKHFQFEYVKST